MGGWHSLATETTTEANLAVSELGLFYTLVPVEAADPVAQVVEEMTTWAHRTESQGDREEAVVPSGTTH